MARAALKCSGEGGPLTVLKYGHKTRVGAPHRLTCRCKYHLALRDFYAANATEPKPLRVVVMSRTRAARDQSAAAKGGAT